jgi:hypothetical protein
MSEVEGDEEEEAEVEGGISDLLAKRRKAPEKSSTEVEAEAAIYEVGDVAITRLLTAGCFIDSALSPCACSPAMVVTVTVLVVVVVVVSVVRAECAAASPVRRHEEG